MIIERSHAALFLLSGVAVSLATSIFEKCTSHDQCPLHARCRPTGCEGYTCRCDVNYVYNNDKSRCLTARRIGHSCNGRTTKCLSNFAICADKECICNELMEKTLDGRCKDPAFRVLEESCQEEECSGGTTCQDGTCVCPEHLRQLTEEEFWIDPMNTDTCIDKDFSLHHCNGSEIEIPAGLLSTPTLSKDTPTLSKVTPPSESSNAIIVPVSNPNTTKIYDTCSTNKECPAHAQCRPQGCKGYSCLCAEGHMSTTDRLSCVKAAKVNEPCDTNSNCISPFAFCDGVCRCIDVFMPTSDGRCKLPDISFVGEKCSAEECEYPATCVGGVCQCVGEYRAVTSEEFWIDPTNIWQCAKSNSSLDTCNGLAVSLPSSLTAAGPRDITEMTSSITVSTEIPYTVSEMGPTTPDDLSTSVASILSTTSSSSIITNVTSDSSPSGFQTTSALTIKTSTIQKQEEETASTISVKHESNAGSKSGSTTESEFVSTESTVSGVTKQHGHSDVTSKLITTTGTTGTGSDSNGLLSTMSTSTEGLMPTRSSKDPNDQRTISPSSSQVDTHTTTLADTTVASTMTPHHQEKSNVLRTSSETPTTAMLALSKTGKSETFPAVASSTKSTTQPTLNPLLTGMNERTSTTMETKTTGSLVTTAKSLEPTFHTSSEGVYHTSSDGNSHTSSDGKSHMSSDGSSQTSSDGKSHTSSDGRSNTSSDGNSHTSSVVKSRKSSDGKSHTSSEGTFTKSSEGPAKATNKSASSTVDGVFHKTNQSHTATKATNKNLSNFLFGHGGHEHDHYLCESHSFICSEILCIPSYWVCDGEKQCPDGRDESPAICHSGRVCPPDEYKCSNFRCIPGSWLCDGEEDCPYREDESTTAGCLTGALDSATETVTFETMISSMFNSSTMILFNAINDIRVHIPDSIRPVTTANTTLTNTTQPPDKEDREPAEKSYTGSVGLGSLESIAIAAAAGLVFLINVIGIILALTRRNRRITDKKPPSTIHTSVTSSDDTESGNFKIPRPNVLYPPYYVKEDWNTWNSSHFNTYTEQMYAMDEHSDFYPGSLKSV